MDSKNTKKKNIEIVEGTGEKLDISPVYSHIQGSKPKTNNKIDKKIVIPKDKKNS